MRRRPRLSAFAVGMATLAVLAVVLFLGFGKDVPFTRPFEVDAVFRSANSIRPGSPVRIAGVTVGKVARVHGQRGSDAAVVTLQIAERGLPIHSDATARIRPRIFLEGNFFVDLRPGTPQKPVLHDGDTIAVTRTATPVQLDQVLTALQDSTRKDLRTVLDELGAGLGGRPSAAQDRRADASVRGQTAAQAINDAYDDIPAAERSTAQVNDALLGVQPGADVRRLLRGLSRTTEGLGRHEAQLQDLVTNLSRTMGALGADQAALRASVRRLAPTLERANGALARLDAAFPATRAFARELRPGVRETPATLAAGFPWIAQARRLLASDELGGLAEDLSPASRDLARVARSSLPLLRQGDRLARCFDEVLLPTGDVPIADEFATGQPNYREFAYSLVGLAGEGQSNDGNGAFVHFQPGGGSQTLRLGSPEAVGGFQYSNAFPGVATRPRKPAGNPPVDSSVPCYRSPRPDLNGPWAAKGSAGTLVGAAARGADGGGP